MARILDLVVTGGRVLDPAGGLDGELDLGVKSGRIVAVEPGGTLANAFRCLDVHGGTVVPGLVDAHVHVSEPFGRKAGLRMVAASGITTCLDLAGDGASLAAAISERGSGIQVGYLSPLIPGRNLAGPDPSEDELVVVIDGALRAGALGVKLLGGHYPLTPEAMKRALAIAADRSCHLAIHCGSTETGSDISGLAEALELAEGYRVQIAHVNSYCRGQLRKDPMEEALEAVDLLAGKSVFSESYLSPFNGTSAECSHGVPSSHVTRTSLRLGGYEETEAGLRRAVADGYGHVNVERPDGTALASGSRGLEHLSCEEPASVISFRVNHPEVTAYLASAKREGRFVVSALATDGGSIPRNTTVEQGLALVRYGSLSLSEFVEKASWAPARMLGLEGRGTLVVGSYADITVLDVERGVPTFSIAAGCPVLAGGLVVGQGGIFLTTERGREFTGGRGVAAEEVRHAA
jgi:hypothetical protein